MLLRRNIRNPGQFKGNPAIPGGPFSGGLSAGQHIGYDPTAAAQAASNDQNVLMNIPGWNVNPDGTLKNAPPKPGTSGAAPGPLEEYLNAIEAAKGEANTDADNRYAAALREEGLSKDYNPLEPAAGGSSA